MASSAVCTGPALGRWCLNFTSGGVAERPRTHVKLSVAKLGDGFLSESRKLAAQSCRTTFHGGRQSCRPGIVRATLAAEGAPPTQDFSKLKADLLAAVAGLDRGLVAEETDEFAANAAATKLEAASNPIQFPEDLDRLDGKWRLVFSSGFNSGSYGGQRPGPSIARSPFTLGTVYQRIDVRSRELDNIVDLRFPVPWPLPPLEITATLAHTYDVVGGAKIRIIFEKTSIKFLGTLSQIPQFELPKLPEFIRPKNDSNGTGRGEFDTTYLDDELRVSRGDRGELRIFVKA